MKLTKIQMQVCKELLKEIGNRVNTYEFIDITFSNSRLNELKEEKSILKHSTNQEIAPTLLTNVDNLIFIEEYEEDK